MIKMELKRAIFSKAFLAACSIAFIMLMIGAVEDIFDYLGRYISPGTWLEKYLGSLAYGTTSLLALFFSIVAIIPYVLVYRRERDSGFLQLMILKSTRNTYVSAKLLAVACSGFLSMFLPNLCWLFLCRFWLGTGSTKYPVLNGFVYVNALYEQQPFLCGLTYVLNAGIVGATFALLALGLTTVIRNRYLAILLPFCYSIFSAAILNSRWRILNALRLLPIELPQSKSFGYGSLLLYDLVLAVIGCVLFVGGDRFAGKA